MNLQRLFLAASVGVSAALSGLSGAQAVTPAPEGSYQHNLLAPHMDYVKAVPGCCEWGEGRGEFEEIVEVRYREDGTPYNHYTVVIDPAAYGLPGEPVAVEIPEKYVMSQDKLDKANKICEEMQTETCLRPSFNMVWATYFKNPALSTTGTHWHVYCYLPKAQMGNAEPASSPEPAA